MTTTAVERNVQAFRTKLLYDAPFYGDVITNIPFYSDPGIQTAQTDGRSIKYNPEFLATLSRGQMNYVLMHEVMHILLKHGMRTGEKRPDLWNAACDLVVNKMLDDQLTKYMHEIGLDFERPANGLFDDDYRSNIPSAEAYYEQLIKVNSRKGHTVTFVALEAYGACPEKRITVPSPHDIPVHPLTAGEAALLDSILRKATDSAQKQRGSGASVCIPEQVLKLTLRKPLPWKQLLKGMLNESEDDSDSSWTTPERKYIHMDLLLPGHCRSEADTLGEVWAFVDSSGSISQPEMSRFLNELWHILHGYHCVLNLAYWDTAVTDVYTRIDSEKKLLSCLPRHTGGTDINCVYSYITKNRLKPEVLLILTDGAFGELTDKSLLRSLKEKTIMVLSNSTFYESSQQYGKIACLKEDN